MFHIGQKVVCINASHAPFKGRPPGLVKGRIYTVSAIGLTNHLDPEQLPCISVDELANPYIAVWSHRFHPVIERKTDISIFTAMLTPSKVNQNV